MFCGLQKFDSVITKIRKNICKSKNIFRCNLCHRETVSLHNSRFQMFVGLLENILRVQIYIRCSSVSRRLPALSKIKTNLNFKPKLPKFHAKYVPKTDTNNLSIFVLMRSSNIAATFWFTLVYLPTCHLIKFLISTNPKNLPANITFLHHFIPLLSIKFIGHYPTFFLLNYYQYQIKILMYIL